MPNPRTLLRSFAGGEMAPQMFGRVDDTRVQNGAARLRNLLIRPEGPVFRRPGTEFVRASKESDPREFTADAGTNICTTTTNHTLGLHQPVRVRSTGTLPGGLSSGVTYYVIAPGGATLQLALTPGGSAVDISSAGSGTHTITGASQSEVLLLPFRYSTDQTTVIEAGNNVLATGTLDTVSATSMTVVDTPWPVAAYGGGAVVLSSGEVGRITTNTNNTLTISAWSPRVPTKDTPAQTFTIYRGYFRFHTDGATLLYATPADYVAPLSISSVDIAADRITFGSPHGLATDDPLRFTIEASTTVVFGAGSPNILLTAHALLNHDQVVFSNSGGALPAEVTAGVTYYVRNAPTADVFTVSATPGGTEITFSTPGTGTQFVGFLPRVGATGGVGLLPSITYYARTISDTVIEVAAAAGGATLDLTHGGYGDRKMHFAYLPGDLVRWTGVGGPFHAYCIASPWDTHTDHPPTDSVYWYQLPATIYEVPHWYPSEHLPQITFDQSNDVLSLGHMSHRPQELRREGATRWTLPQVKFNTTLGTPAGLSATVFRGEGLAVTTVTAASPAVLTTTVAHDYLVGDAVFVESVGDIPDGNYVVGAVPSTTTLHLRYVDGGQAVASGSTAIVAGSRVRRVSVASTADQAYVVTAVGDDNAESLPSATLEVECNLFAPGSSITLSWSAVADASRYRIYKRETGLFGLIGQVEADLTTFRDDDGGVQPDLSRTPPMFDDSLSGSDFPGAVGRFEQRRVFAGTFNKRNRLWMTRSGTETDLSFALPVRDDDRVQGQVVAKDALTIRHILPLGHLLLLADSGEFRVSPLNSDSITPASISVRPQTYVGAARVQPVVVNSTALFVANRGGHLRELGYAPDAGGFVTGDVSVRSPHLFDTLQIRQLAYSRAPLPLVWAISSSGRLLTLTYVPEEQVGAWSAQETDGAFESVTVVAEGDEDRVYVVVRRTVNGLTVRYIERMAVQAFTILEACHFVDAGLTYDGAPATTITGLEHLEGATVAVLADGVVVTDQTVVGGRITLSTAASVVHVGLPFTSELQTLPLLLQVDGFGGGRHLNVTDAWLRVLDSARFQVGPTAQKLGVATGLPAVGVGTGTIAVGVPGQWGLDGQILVRQSQPVPLTVVSLVLRVAVGD